MLTKTHQCIYLIHVLTMGEFFSKSNESGEKNDKSSDEVNGRTHCGIRGLENSGKRNVGITVFGTVARYNHGTHCTVGTEIIVPYDARNVWIL